MRNKKNQSGVALIIVLMSMALIAIFITQLVYTSNIDLTITKKNQKRLQAYYLAHSAARMGLLRIHIFKELENMLTGSSFANMVPPAIRPMVWSFPLPEFPLPPGESKLISESPGKFISIVKGEGSKIPINLLDGDFHRMLPSMVPDKDVAKDIETNVRKQIQQLIELRVDTDDKFREKFQQQDENAYVDALKDWMDTDNNRAEGGDESTIYDRKTPPYRQRNDRIPFLSEVSMVDLWEDEVFSIFKNEFSTINLFPRINCNTISLDRLKAYSKNQLTDASLGLIAKRRLEEPFASVTECETFIKTNPDIVGGGDFNFPPEVKKYEATREDVFIVEGSSNVGDSRALIRLYVRLEEEPAKNNNNQQQQQQQQGGQNQNGGGNTPAAAKFSEVRVIRFEEGAPK